jgi:hypothetical protein
MRYLSPGIPDSRGTRFHPDFAVVTPFDQEFPGGMRKPALKNFHAGTEFLGQTHTCRGVALKDVAAIFANNLFLRPFCNLFTRIIKKYHLAVYVLYHNPFTCTTQGMDQNLIRRINFSHNLFH